MGRCSYFHCHIAWWENSSKRLGLCLAMLYIPFLMKVILVILSGSMLLFCYLALQYTWDKFPLIFLSFRGTHLKGECHDYYRVTLSVRHQIAYRHILWLKCDLIILLFIKKSFANKIGAVLTLSVETTVMVGVICRCRYRKFGLDSICIYSRRCYSNENLENRLMGSLQMSH